MAVNSLLTPHQIERFPHFTQLLKDLFENRISSNFVTRSKTFERQQGFQEYEKTKNEYEMVKLVYDTLWDIVADASLEDEFLKRLEKALMSSELEESMKIPKDSDSSSDSFFRIFGVEFKKEQFDDDIKIWTEEKLVNKLMEMGTTFLQQLGQDVQGSNQDLLLAKINQLPMLISSRLEALNNAKEAMIGNDHILKEQYTKYISTLLESLKIMEDLLNKHILEIQKEQYYLRSESIQVHCDALYLKIKSLRLEILCETYTKETVLALKKISKEMEAKSDQIENDIQSSKVRLSRYESVGQDFNCIVNEYSKLREAIKQKKWTLDKLKSYCP